jgi:predicted ATP-dependent serine protease
MREWKCSICDYVHEGDNPPGECPHCESIAEVFSEQSNKKENEAKPKQLEKKVTRKLTSKKKTSRKKVTIKMN